jgi:hypothetical protein
MEKREKLSDEQILGYMRQGWRIRRKKVGKKYEYIIRRRRKSERSMGPFNEEKWNRILALEYKFHSEKDGDRISTSRRKSLTLRDRRRIARSQNQLENMLRTFRGIQMSKTCIHAEDDFCMFWKWEKNMFSGFYADILRPGSEYNRRIVSDEGEEAWIFQTYAFYCAGCAVYTPRAAEIAL